MVIKKNKKAKRPKSKLPAWVAKSTKTSRQLKHPKYKSFRVSRRISHPTKLPAARLLLWRSLKHLAKNWKIFLGIVLIYGVLTLILVRGFGVNSSIPQTKELLQSFIGGTNGKITSGVTLFGVLLGSNATASEAASAYQSMLVIVTSLALIWALRQTYTKAKIRIRDTFYKGLYPLVPFVLVVLSIGLQLIPLLLASLLYSLVFGNGVAVTILEKTLWGSLLFFMALLSLYMITSSIFALYIVTLPDVAPVQALRAARELVRFRRWTVMRKFIFLPIVMVIVAGLVLIPILLYATVVAEWLYFGLTMVALAVLHSYMYALYRELIA